MTYLLNTCLIYLKKNFTPTTQMTTSCVAMEVCYKCVKDLQREGEREGFEGVSRTAKCLSFLLYDQLMS